MAKQSLTLPPILLSVCIFALTHQIQAQNQNGVAPIYNPVAEFSATQNPKGTWAYGYRSPGGEFIRYAQRSQPWGASIDVWQQSASDCCPLVAFNNSGTTQVYAGNQVSHPPGWLNLHPGAQGARSVVRWTAESAGSYRVEGQFRGLDQGAGTTTDVIITHNSAVLFQSAINGFGNQAGFALNINAALGDTVEFSVGDGNNNYGNDSTGLAVKVLPASETIANSEASGMADIPVAINFDELPHATVLAESYNPYAVFSTTSGKVVAVYNPTVTADTVTAESPPNVISRGTPVYPFSWDHAAPLTVDFKKPVNDLKFVFMGIDSFPGVRIALVDVYQNGQYATTREVPSYGRGTNVILYVGQPSYVNGINSVTRIVVRDIVEGIGFDNFSFGVPEPRLEKINLTNPRVGGLLNDTTQNALVGADIILQSNPSPSGLTGGTYSWSFTGPVSVSGGATNSPSVTIRPTDVGTITAKASYTRNTVTVTATVTINSTLPTLASFSASQYGDLLGINGPCEGSAEGRVLWSLGCAPYEKGINFKASAQTPSTYISEPAQSGIKYVQAINTLRKLRFASGNVECRTARNSEDDLSSGWRIDNGEGGPGDPYQDSPQSVRNFSQGNLITITTSDSPSLGWRQYSLDAAKVDDRFQMYVVYFAGDPRTSRFQKRLGSLSWNWGGQVVFNSITPSANTDALHQKQALYASSGSRERDASLSTLSYQGNVEDLHYARCPGGPAPVESLIDGSRYFVEQHYMDFFNRLPDQSGADYWTSNITPCGFDAGCIDRKRVDVSRAFFYSGEFIALHPELGGARGTHEYNSAFVLQCYRTYLRREPNAPPDNGWSGFDFWVGVLDSTNPQANNEKYNEVIRAFIVSGEYRGRPFTPR